MSAAMTEGEALKRAAMWLGALIEAAECDPAETTVRLRIRGGARSGEVLTEVNLADDLATFAALGARSDMFEEV